MTERRRIALGAGIVVSLFLFVQVAAVSLVEPFQAAGYQPVEDPRNPANSILYVGAILVATALMLVAFRYDVDQVIRALIVVSGAWLSLYVFSVVIPAPAGQTNPLAFLLAAGLGVALYVYPEWYVIDAAGAVMGAAAAGLFGIGFGVFPALVLLTVLAVYDAISVYRTEHMLTLASGVMDLKVPVVLVIPLTTSYSFLDAEVPDETGDVGEDGSAESEVETDPTETDPLDREALFVGLGDAVIPTVLVASAAFFAPEGVPTVLGVAVPAVTAMLGTYVGLAALLWMVLKGRPHAGLPLLNGGSIGGYLLGALASGLSLAQALGVQPYF